jgi:hypothetical protein
MKVSFVLVSPRNKTKKKKVSNTTKKKKKMNILTSIFQPENADEPTPWPERIAAVLLAATCVGNDGKSCPLLHGSLGPKFFSKIRNAPRLQLFLLHSDCITWTDTIHFPSHNDVENDADASYSATLAICKRLAATRYSSESIKSIVWSPFSDQVYDEVRHFIKNHCHALESFYFGLTRYHLGKGKQDLFDYDLSFLSHKKRSSSLRVLEFACEMKIACLEQIANVTSLRSLKHPEFSDYFGGDGDDDEDAKAYLSLANLSGLEELDLHSIQNAKKIFPFLKCLTSLHLSSIKTTELKPITSLVNLRRLCVAQVNGPIEAMEENFIAIFDSCVLLEDLVIPFTRQHPFSPQFFSVIGSNLTRLLRIDVSSCSQSVTDQNMSALCASLQSPLVELDLRGVCSLTDAGIKTISETNFGKTTLQRLLLRMASNLTDESLRYMSEMRALEELSLVTINNFLTGTGFSHFFDKTTGECKTPRLRILTLSSSTQLLPLTLEYITRFKSLEELTINDLPKLGNDWYKLVAKRLRRLRHLHAERLYFDDEAAGILVAAPFAASMTFLRVGCTDGRPMTIAGLKSIVHGMRRIRHLIADVDASVVRSIDDVVEILKVNKSLTYINLVCYGDDDSSTSYNFDMLEMKIGQQLGSHVQVFVQKNF